LSDPKRGGSRDISELKQRLGLKKGGPPSGAGAARPAAGGVVPPPGMNLTPPPPPQPVIPNAADDPFGAMNAMAAVGTVQRAPEIVIVNDGKPVENVGTSGRGAAIAKAVIPAVIALAAGVAIGQIARAARLYNDGLKDARTILGDDKAPSTVKNLKRTLADLDSALEELKAKTGLHPDTAGDKKLDAVARRIDEVKTVQVFRTTSVIDPELWGMITSFYAGVAEVKGMLDTHIKSAKADDLALARGKAATEEAAVKETRNATLAAAGAIKYGALIQAPTETDHTELGVRIVELGPPYCGGASPSTTGRCENNEAPTGYGYRSEPGAGVWTKGDLYTQGTDNVPAKKLLLLLPGGTRDELIKGGDPGASEVFYVKRLRALSERAKKLLEDANRLEQRLQTEANKGTRFSFFL
jgi:hypothetical protein